MMGAADLDNSGSLDIFGYSKNAEYGVTLMNDGTGQFTRKSNAFDLGDVQDAYWVASSYHAADINSDGYLDIAMVEYQSGGSDGATVFLFYVAPEVGNGADDLAYGRLVLHDWNGDSLPDVTVAYYTGPWVEPVIEIFLNAPAESVLEPTLALGVGETTNIFVATPIVH